MKRVREVIKPLSISAEDDADASVALLLRRVDRGLKLLLVKRAENHLDPWSGQIALPGGRRGFHDMDMRETTAREVLEEVNIDLQEGCRFLGVMPIQRSSGKPPVKVLPFIILLEHEPDIKLNSRELETHLWASIKDLTESKGRVMIGCRERSAYMLGRHVVWGLTYRILNNFIRALGSDHSTLLQPRY